MAETVQLANPRKAKEGSQRVRNGVSLENLGIPVLDFLVHLTSCHLNELSCFSFGVLLDAFSTKPEPKGLTTDLP